MKQVQKCELLYNGIIDVLTKRGYDNVSDLMDAIWQVLDDFYDNVDWKSED